MKPYLYRNCCADEIITLLDKGEVKSINHDYVSFSTVYDSAQSVDASSPYVVTFDAKKVYNQGAKTIIYEAEFLHNHPEFLNHISKNLEVNLEDYMSGFAGLYDEAVMKRIFIEDIIDERAHENEAVLPKLKFVSGLIVNIENVIAKESGGNPYTLERKLYEALKRKAGMSR